MAVYQTAVIKEAVRIALDQNTQSESLIEIGDVDTLSIDEIIESKIEEAVKRVHSLAPLYLLDSGDNLVDTGEDLDDAIYWNEDEANGYILLPDDFMRLIVFEMDDWERAVFEPINMLDEAYKKQSSRVQGIRGTVQKPVCVISMRPEGRVLEFYSCNDTSALITRGVYIPYPKIDEDGGIEICERCYDAVIHTIVALVLITYGDIEKSNVFIELAKSALL